MTDVEEQCRRRLSDAAMRYLRECRAGYDQACNGGEVSGLATKIKQRDFLDYEKRALKIVRGKIIAALCGIKSLSSG